MFGCLFGLACLAGLYMYVTREDRGYGRRHANKRHRWFRRRMLQRVYDELDTTVSQEQVIENALRELAQDGTRLREDLGNGRQEIANAFRSETFDREHLDTWFGQKSSSVVELKQRVLEALQKVHDTLDPQQRLRFSALLSDGLFGSKRGCYRRHWL